MTEKKNPLGPIGERVQWNVERLRTARKLTKADLSARTKEAGRLIPPLGISRIEAGTRRVDADDLVVLALALNVSPSALLLPPSAGPEQINLTPTYQVSSDTAWLWAVGRRTAMDWEPGEGVPLAGSGADPAIDAEAYEREKEFGRRQVAYESLSGPEGLRRGSSHPAVRLARNLADVIVDLVAPSAEELQSSPNVQATRSRMARRRYAQLGIELDEIEDALTEYEARDVEVFREPGRSGQRYKWARKDGTGPEYPIEIGTEAGTHHGEEPPEPGSPTSEKD
ncbi:helix-turn-helix transcriptional regulator [Catenulispora yoronensis]|uniref:helix-turn-helix domain-containing protein n=1 Tax=Catenulispora yoronensis TaxID=450799 RepID=UPI0031E0827C